jgi:hypothetical protein
MKRYERSAGGVVQKKRQKKKRKILGDCQEMKKTNEK